MRSEGAESDLLKVKGMLHNLDDVCEKLSSYITIPTDYRTGFLKKRLQETKRLLGRPIIWKSVVIVAHDLYDWHSLTGHDVADTVQWVRSHTCQCNFLFTYN